MIGYANDIYFVPQLERIRTHGYSWMVPEGKQLNQEAEADVRHIQLY